MIDSDWERPREAPLTGVAVQVAAIAPLPEEMGGSGEVLALAAFGSAKLPAGGMRAGESVLAAAERILLGTTGASAVAERVVYVHEAVGRQITFCVLCALNLENEADERAGVRFVAPDGDDVFEPVGVGELLVEDLRAGFVRPIAYVRAIRNELGRERVESTW